GNALAGAFRVTGWPRGLAFRVVDLPSHEVAFALPPSHQRASVGRVQSKHAHAGSSRRFDLSRHGEIALVVNSSKIDLIFGRPNCHEPALDAAKGIVSHGTRIDLPQAAADTRPHYLATVLVP